MRRRHEPILWSDVRKANGLDPRLVRQIRLSGAALLWERFWLAVWPLIGFVGLFLIASLFGVWNEISEWLHLLMLLCFFAAFVWGITWACSSIRLPDLTSCINRLEREGGRTHRPIRSLLDVPATPLDEPEVKHLWKLHMIGVAGAVRRLKVAWPAFTFFRRDQFGVRAAILLFVAIGFVVSGKDAPGRLAAAGKLQLSVFEPGPPGTLTAWVTPPAYTNLAPIFLTDRSDGEGFAESSGRLLVAEGSRFVARVHGGNGEPTLKAPSVGADVPTPQEKVVSFQVADEGNYSADKELFESGAIQVFQNHVVLGQWEFEVIVDDDPVVEFSEAPQKTHKEVLRLGYRAEDDYGVSKIVAHIARSDVNSEPFLLPLRVPGGVRKSIEEFSYHDLTPHPWAGLPVTVRLVVQDVAGQSGQSPLVNLELPARIFKHPVAKEIVNQRRVLALDLGSPEVVKNNLDVILQTPEQFGDDVVAYMSLRTALARLEVSGDDGAKASVVDLLWEAALRIEDGNLSIAERDLRASEEALRDALDRNASNDEILELTRDLQKKLDQFLELLQSESEKYEQGPFGDAEQAGFDPDSELPETVDHAGNTLNPEAESQRRAEMQSQRELQEMVERARDLALTGSREAAQSMLQELQETIENLQRGQGEQRSNAESGQGRDLEALENVAEEQDSLLNETFEQLRGDQGAASPAALETQQQAGAVAQESGRAQSGDSSERRDDQIERMDDLDGGDPSPTASRQNNSVQQTEDQQMGQENAGNDTQTRGDPAGGDQPAAMAPRTRDAMRQDRSGGDSAMAPSQAGRGGEGAEGETRQTGAGRSARQHSDSSAQSNAQRQEELSQRLGDVMRDMEETGAQVPAELGEAAQFMRDAVEALTRGRPDRAVRSQTQALNQLRQGAATLRGQRTNNRSSNEQTEESSSQRLDNLRDPFGRRPPGKNGDPTGYVEIPAVSDVQRSRQILDELYRRSGDAFRSEPERSYIERLLRWY